MPGAPVIEYPEALPVSARREEIARALREHQTLIVCGETGSGKTTQLPKMALELALEQDRARPDARRRWIGHTQPRRIAATSVARRIADELKTPLGETVGYKIRFSDRLAPGAAIKLMTDGILLAETQGDPLLQRYRTLIVDEAHERSLNIDFLLGYLRNLLPQRPDLKLVITSATIDADRFAAYFASPAGPAPVIQVSGRLYPVEQRWRPYEESRDYGQDDAIADAVDELWREGPGDILVFLPGEREIRDAAAHLQQHLARQRHNGPPAEILPLFARLSQAEQDRVFTPGRGRRVVLATNVAETSLTVPGIRYVVDSGLSRVKRWSFRSKVEQLLVEPISQAAASQRAGRCGRVANGICIRLYAESEWPQRPKFTDPEILRSSLAGVILRMKALNLPPIDEFPFLEPPRSRAIADGYALLDELGAIDEQRELTPIGQALSRLPLDPRLGRMILEAQRRDALSEALIVTAALSVQDVRDRPLDQQQAADQKHKLFDDEKSEFSGYLKLWQWVEQGRGVHGHAGQGIDTHKLSNRQQEARLREHFVNPRRVREWRDTHAQLYALAAEQGWRLNGAPATYEQLHLAMLAGLLGNLGCKADDDDHWLGARGIKFWPFPGAHLSKKPARWLMCAELVETSRLWGRGIAQIEPRWIEQVGGHLLKRQLLEPHWERKAGEVVAMERATLYGLVVYSNRRVPFARVDAAGAREIFIRQALVECDWQTRLPFFEHNQRLLKQVQELEHKSRRQDVLVDDELIHAFYDRLLPADVLDASTLEKWYRLEAKRQPRLLMLVRDELMRHEAAGVTSAAYPKLVRLGGVDCAASYLHEPGDPRDGVTVTVPIYALNQVAEDRCEWLVPGLLPAKVQALLKTLPGKPRSRCMPLAEYAERFCSEVSFGDGSLIDQLCRCVRESTQLPVQRADFKLEALSPHLLLNLLVVDEHGRQLGIGRNVAALKAAHGHQARHAFQALAQLALTGVRPPAEVSATAAPPAARRRADTAMAEDQGSSPVADPPQTATGPFTAWTFGELPELMEVRRGAQVLVGFPALVDRRSHVEIEVFDEPELAAQRHREGLRRLVALALREPLRYVERQLPGFTQLTGWYMPLGTADELREQILGLAIDRAFLGDPLPADAAAFAQRLEAGRGRLNLIAQEVTRQAATVLAEHAAAARKLKDSRAPREVADDIEAQLARLVPKGVVLITPAAQWPHLPRYLKAIALRLDKLRADPARDAQRLAELRPLEQRWLRRVAELRGRRDPRVEEFRWLLEELRVSLFAQELRTPQPVSVKRLERAWEQLSR